MYVPRVVEIISLSQIDDIGEELVHDSSEEGDRLDIIRSHDRNNPDQVTILRRQTQAIDC